MTPTAATSTSFWHRACESLFIKSQDWHRIVRSLPTQVDIDIITSRTIPYQTITGMGIRAEGWIGNDIVSVANPNPIQPGDFIAEPIHWSFWQIFSQFSIMEGMVNLLIAELGVNPREWPTDFENQMFALAMTASYFSAYLILAEEDRLPIYSSDAPIPEFNNPQVISLCVSEISKITETLTSKTQDYGQAFLRHGLLGLLYRLWDKIARYATLSAENRPSKYESRKDTAMDMLGYSVLIWSIIADIKQVKETQS